MKLASRTESERMKLPPLHLRLRVMDQSFIVCEDGAIGLSQNVPWEGTVVRRGWREVLGESVIVPNLLHFLCILNTESSQTHLNRQDTQVL